MLNRRKATLIKNIVDQSYKANLGHIPSALSMFNYVFEVSKLINPVRTNIVIGKPFGALAYYEAWKELKWIRKDMDTSEYPIVLKDKHEPNKLGFPFVDFSAETMGNSLGVACGYSIDSHDLTWVNTSDAALQMGSELEAILHISQMSKKGCNMLITIDNNNSQVCGKTEDVNSIAPVIAMLKASNIEVYEVADASLINNDFSYQNKTLKYMIERAKLKDSPAVCIIFNTLKGYPVKTFTQDPAKHHYSKMDEEMYNTISEELKEYFGVIGAPL